MDFLNSIHNHTDNTYQRTKGGGWGLDMINLG